METENGGHNGVTYSTVIHTYSILLHSHDLSVYVLVFSLSLSFSFYFSFLPSLLQAPMWWRDQVEWWCLQWVSTPRLESSSLCWGREMATRKRRSRKVRDGGGTNAHRHGNSSQRVSDWLFPQSVSCVCVSIYRAILVFLRERSVCWFPEVRFWWEVE